MKTSKLVRELKDIKNAKEPVWDSYVLTKEQRSTIANAIKKLKKMEKKNSKNKGTKGHDSFGEYESFGEFLSNRDNS